MWIYIPQQVDKQSLTSVSPAFFKDSRVFAGTIILYNDSAAYAKFSWRTHGHTYLYLKE